jgi:hypothetical protein
MASLLPDDRQIGAGRLWGARVFAAMGAVGGFLQSAGPVGGWMVAAAGVGALAGAVAIYWVALRLLSTPAGEK